MPEWLDKLKVGDAVIRQFGGYHDSYVVGKVSHATGAQVHVDGRKFRRKDGYMVGDPYRASISEATPDRIQQLRDTEHRQTLVGTIRKVFDYGSSRDALTLDQLERIHAVLNEGQAAE